jgi:hypothetical protein
MKRQTVPLAAALAMLSLLTAAPATSQTACSVTNQRTGVNYTSLSSAVSAANAGDTLLIQNTCGGNIEINKSLTLRGQRPAGSPPPIITATTGGSVLTVGNLANVQNLRIANLRITGGHGVTFPMVGLRGGGISIYGGSTVTLASARVANNRAENGGGVATDGKLVMNGSSRIIGNTIRFGGGGVAIGCAIVGPLGCAGTGTLVMNDHSAIVDNLAGAGGGASSGSGGGVFIFTGGTLKMRENSTIARNTATTLLGQGIGGGVSNSGFVFLNGNSTITENVAGFDGGGIFNFTGNGGGQLTLNGGRVFNNTPNDVCTLTDSGPPPTCT